MVTPPGISFSYVCAHVRSFCFLSTPFHNSSTTAAATTTTSLSGFAVAIQTLDVSIAYACWAAIGTMVVSVAGMVWLEEPLYPAKLMCLVLIVMGVVGLELLPPPPN